MARILSRRADGAPPAADAPPSDQPTAVVPAQAAGEEVAVAEVVTPEQPAVEEDVTENPPPPTPGVEANAAAAEAEQPTAVLPAVDPDAPPTDPSVALAAAEADPTLPAGAEPVPPEAPSFRNRGRLRRRLRYLRRVREIALRDLGGLVFDLDRFGRERPDLVQTKLAGLASIDAELRTLEVALDDVRAVEELEEPGISACTRCGTLHGSEARFCPSCGTAVDAPADAPELPAAAPEPEPPAAEQPEPPADQPPS